MQYHDKFETEIGLISRYSADKAFLVWAMGLYLDIQDLESMADENLTDNCNDHGIDFLRYDEDAEALYLAQGYHTNKVKQSAPASKAADLNAACAWLMNGEIERFNPEIQRNIIEARTAILNDDVQKITLVYAHNCVESIYVHHELEIAKAEKDIADRVKASVEKSQREFYLRRDGKEASRIYPVRPRKERGRCRNKYQVLQDL